MKLYKKILNSIVIAFLITGCLNIKAEETGSDNEENLVEESDQDEMPQNDVRFHFVENSQISETQSDQNTSEVEEGEASEDKIFTYQEENLTQIKAEELDYEFNQEVIVDDVKITVSAKEGVLPANSTLFAEKVEIESLQDALDEVREENKNVALSYTYDIKIIDENGEEIQPDGRVSIVFSLINKVSDVLDVNVYHSDEDLNIMDLNPTITDNTNDDQMETDIEVDTFGFSYYTVEFTYDELTISIEGDSIVDLDYVLDYLGINGEVENVEISDPSLFDIYKENDYWEIVTLQAFTSEESAIFYMVDGSVFNVKVTDAINTTFYIEAVEATDIALVMVGSPTIGTVKYGINNSSPSTTYTVTTSSSKIHLTAGQKCYWTITSTTTAFNTSKYLKFTSTGKINVGGNLSSLIGGESYLPRNYCFNGLFRYCSKLIDASAINFGSITSFNSKTYAYSYMFYDCTSLTTAPELSATTLANNCYQNMFRGCTSLTTAPKLPATTLADSCYQNMFYGCTGLTTAPALPATTLASNCYAYMFSGCISLTSAPALPATTLANYCYNHMFQDCTGLTTVPELPATTLADYCYESMFDGCTGLTTAPELPATTLADYCYQSMFDGCTSLTTAPELPATTLAESCYVAMFSGCTSLTTAPELPATTLAQYCYAGMFQYCTCLTSPPALPATTLASNCYSDMFYGCTEIKLSETQAGIYQKPYRIPKERTGTTASSALTNMFTNTGGIFTGTPSINTTYYIPYDYTDSFYIEAVENTTITLSKVGSPTVGTATYGIDSMPRTAYTYGDSINLSASQKCYWTITSTSTDFSYSNYLKFTSTGKIKIGGNLSTLIGGNSSLPRNYCFANLFKDCTQLVDISDLNFGSINNFNSKFSAFSAMFSGCTSLTTAPSILPVTTLTRYCYSEMFKNCTSLTTAPKLLATTLAAYCCQDMFYGCTSLTVAPELPATTIDEYCYTRMFSGCTSLTTAPTKLPATTLANWCYANMFYNCTSLITIPELPATALATTCYSSMFEGCTSLTTLPELPATTLAQSCYYGMFYRCTGIRLSETQTGIYQIPYRIPTVGTGMEGTNSLFYMFANTGGTFKGTPKINTVYYMPGNFIEIPATVDVTQENQLTINYYLLDNRRISIVSENQWKLKKGNSALDYSLSETSFILPETEGDEETKSLAVEKTGIPTQVGEHTDNLTFTISEPTRTYLDMSGLLDEINEFADSFGSGWTPYYFSEVQTGLQESELEYNDWTQGWQIQDENHYTYINYDGTTFKTTADEIVIGNTGPLNFAHNEDFDIYFADYSAIGQMDLSRVTSIEGLCDGGIYVPWDEVEWNKDFSWADDLPEKLTGMEWTARNLKDIFPYDPDVILPNWTNGTWVNDGEHYSFIPN